MQKTSAGKQLGFKGKRSSLFFTVTGLVQDLEEKDKPSILFFENVKNLLSVNRGLDFAKLLAELDEIGYDAEWALINSADVVPQNRERVFIIGHLRGRDRQQVFPIEKDNEQVVKLSGYTTNTFTPRSCASCSVGTYVVESQQQAQDAIGGNHDACVMIKTATKLGYELAKVNRDGIYLSFPDSKTRRGRVGKDKVHTLDTACSQGIATSNLWIRKLTPLECWRLQGWHDEDFFKAFFLDKELGVRFNKIYQKHKQNPVRLMQWAFKYQKMSDSQLYKQAGNGVTVTVIQHIGEKLKEITHDV